MGSGPDVLLPFMIISLSLGIIFLTVSFLVFCIENKKQKRCSAKTVGRIVNYRYVKTTSIDDTDSHGLWYPVFEYFVNGVVIRKQSNFGKDRKTFEIGAPVQIFYDPDNPETYYIGEIRDAHIIFVSFLFVGIGLITAAVIIGYLRSVS